MAGSKALGNGGQKRAKNLLISLQKKKTKLGAAGAKFLKLRVPKWHFHKGKCWFGKSKYPKNQPVAGQFPSHNVPAAGAPLRDFMRTSKSASGGPIP